MPFLFVAIGIILVLSAVRGTHRELGALVRGDFSGPNNFFIWLLAIGAVGAIGYIDNKGARSFSRAFMALVLVSMLLSNRGFFTQLFGAFQNVQGGESAGSGAAGNTVGQQKSQAELVQAGENAIVSMAGQGASAGQIAGAMNQISGIAKIVTNPLKSISGFLGGLF